MAGIVKRNLTFSFVFLVMIGSLLLAPSGATAETGLTTKISDALSSVYNSATRATFTITRIDPLPAQNSVNIQFTDACRLEDLRDNLKLIPPAPLEWHNSFFARDKNLLTLRGHFTPGQRYAIVLSPKFTSATGKNYARGQASFTMPDRNPDIAFLQQGSVIEAEQQADAARPDHECGRGSGQGHADTPGPRAAGDDAASAGPVPGSSCPARKTLGKDGDFEDIVGDVTEEEQLFFTLQNEKNLYNQFSIPLTFRKDKERGVVEVIQVMNKRSASNAESKSRLFRITDIGITYKRSETELLIWATSLYSGKPLANVALYGFTSQNEVVLLGRTDARGLHITQNNILKKTASLAGNEGGSAAKPIDLGQIRIVAAATPGDQTFVEIVQQGNVQPEGVEQAAAARAVAGTTPAAAPEGKAPAKKKKKAKRMGSPNPANPAQPVGFLRGHVFTERGIYRPGETVYFKGTVREYRDGKVVPPDQRTVKFRIVNSKSEEIYSKDLTLSEFGTASDQAGLKGILPARDLYRCPCSTGRTDNETASRSFEVQEFRQPQALRGDQLQTGVQKRRCLS